MATEITSVIPDEDGGRRQLRLRRISLRVVEGPDAGAGGDHDADVIRIGARSTSSLVLTDPTVSRDHAEIIRTPDGIVLRDVGSTNGTFVGEVRIREVYLPESREFRVGKTAILFRLLDELVEIVPQEADHFEGMVGASVAMREVFAVLDRVARTGLTVLVGGETGTGKELVSRAVHNHSTRQGGPFVVFDCGSVARGLVESELFGHVKGAFTGAVADRAGVFEQAHGGTLFLDELGELPIELQPTLLRVLEQREVRRLGDRRTIPVDVRVVAATNRDLRRQVQEGRFREDLYYRLAVVELRLPPLRERLEDLPVLVTRILSTAGFPHRVRGLSPEVERLFLAWDWPGNVRELRNVVLRSIPFADGDLIGLEALPEALRTAGEAVPVGSFHAAREQILASFERRYLADVLERCAGDLGRAAREAGVDRKGFARMLRRHGLGDGH